MNNIDKSYMIIQEIESNDNHINELRSKVSNLITKHNKPKCGLCSSLDEI